MMREPISLNTLARTDSAEIDRLMAAMRRETDAKLWTTEVRVTTRGGKCGVLSDEGSDT
jgi:hypothetical protein